MKKFAISIFVIIILIIAAISGAAFAYSKTSDYSSSSFPDNTSINGIDCSGLTYEAAETKLAREWNQKHLTITGSLNNKLTSFTDFGYEYNLMPHLKTVKKKNIIAAAANYYINAPLNVSMFMAISDYDKDFKQEVVTSSCFTVKNSAPSQDAYVDLTDRDFPIIPEIYGTEPDTEKLFADITHSVELGEMNFVFDEKEYLSSPDITSDDPDLIEYQKYCKKHLSQKITYKLGDETFTISPEQLNSMLLDDMSGNVDTDAVSRYVAALAAEYDNINVTREFTALTGKDVSVPPGTYGWEIDQEAETEKLISDIKSHKDVTRQPEFSTTGYGEYSRDMGNTYIDVDISEQMVRFYKKGELVFSSPCVTGCRATGTVTDVGAYYILNKVRDVTLKGDNGDGTKYASFVNYWLGVNWAGEGFHDASWRSTFGGSIWTYNGSHGCINMPVNRMPELYNMTDVGIPVAVHY